MRTTGRKSDLPGKRKLKKSHGQGTSKAHPQTPKQTDQKKLAVGALLAFYRHLRERSRQQLASAATISVSLLAMVENGTRLPSQEVLEKLGEALGLSTYQRLQLHAIAGYSAQLPEAPGWEVRADDLIRGVPLFLRNTQLEFQFQGKLDIEEAWIVTRRPMALDEPVLSMLKSKLLHTDANYVYFVDARTGEDDFKTLWNRLYLEGNPHWLGKKKQRAAAGTREQLTFVLSPPTLCASIHTVSLFNPRSTTKPRFGRAAYYGGGTPIGVYPLDFVLYEQLVSLLKEVYVDCEKNPERMFPKDPTVWGSFKIAKAI
jgi:transcriptional regulator with XRE-family HTH domain